MMGEHYKRTVEDVENMLVCSKQNDEVNPLTQIFYYPMESECRTAKENFHLMAIDEDFIKKLENGESLVFKGSGEEKVVLCSENETFEVKEGEISNSLLLCPNLLFYSEIKDSDKKERVLKTQQVYGIHHNYLELRLTFPRLSKLKEVLQETEYNGPNVEDNNHQGYYTFELLDIIQCSRNELLQSLRELKAFCVDGKWRVLSLTYTTDVFSYIISLMERVKWKEINVLETKKHLQTLVPEFIIDHILQHYAIQIDEEGNLFKFREDTVARCYAELLLRTAEGKFRYNEFMMAWTQCLEPVINGNLDDLKGLILIENIEGHQKAINLFPEEDLPENIPERFRLLFKRKEKWTLDEITPYIEKLATKAMNVNTMLTKYTRSSNVGGKKLFSARYAK